VAQVDTRTFFAAGRPGSGWQWFAGTGADSRQAHELPGGVGMASEGRLRLQATDHAAQEDSRLLSWGGGGASIVGLSGKSPIDLQRESNGQLSLGFDYRLGKPSKADVAVVMECGAGCRGSVPITQALGSSPAGQWMHLKIPLACFARAGADMSRISAPFSVTTGGELELSVGSIHLETGMDKVLDCAH
jgi:beta-glucosidase